MGNVKIVDIALSTGVCPICLASLVDASGIDTFSSVNAFKEILKINEMPVAKLPFSHGDSWVYYCETHGGPNDLETPDDEVDILDVIEDEEELE